MLLLLWSYKGIYVLSFVDMSFEIPDFLNITKKNKNKNYKIVNVCLAFKLLWKRDNCMFAAFFSFLLSNIFTYKLVLMRKWTNCLCVDFVEGDARHLLM